MPGSTRLRLDGYVRVSDVRGRSGPSFISPENQRDRIRAWCSLYDARLLEIYEELDESGRRSDRPLLMQAIARVEAGISGGLIVARMDRFGRSLRDALDHIEQIQNAGGTFVSVDDNFDLSTDQGRLMMRMMGSFAEYESDRIRTSWRIAREKAVARGVHGSGIAPVGYRTGTDGRLRVDSRTAPAVRGAFALRADGGTLEQAGQILRDRRIRSRRGGRLWTRTSMGHLFENRVYLGEAHAGVFVCADAHVPLVDELTWLLAQHQPAVQRKATRPGLLYGILRCASCRSFMTIGADHPDRLYRCSRKPEQLGPCPKRCYVTASGIEALAEALLFSVARRRPQLTRQVQSELRRREQDVWQLQGDLERYRDSRRLFDVLGEERFAGGLNVRNDRLEDAVEELAIARANSRSLDVLRLRGAERRWDELDVYARRELLACAFDALFLKPGNRHFEDRLWICERGEAPTSLPRVGKPRSPRPFAFPTAVSKRLRQERRFLAARRCGWSEEEIERRLRIFTARRKRFPTPAEFFAADERRLYNHIMLQGGGPVWAARVGKPFPQGKRSECMLWTEERVRDELARFLKGRTTWPKGDEFKAARRDGLRKAVKRFGGMERWAAEFELPMANFRGPHLRWTDREVERAIRELIEDLGRDEWPRRREFSRAGLDGCYAAMWRTGGTEVWVPRMRLVAVRSPSLRSGVR